MQTVTGVAFALNHMTAPQLPVAAFFSLARSLGITDVEIRNDIPGQAIFDGTPAAHVRSLAESEDVRILSINALQRFNHWSADRAAEAEALADYAARCGSRALVLVAANDGTRLGREERLRDATEALVGLKPILAARGLTGLVECLGFQACSLRSKREAVAALTAAEGDGVFLLTHDTFHHHLAGEPELFPRQTGLIHLSGVDDPVIALDAMRDTHRVLVGPNDRLGTVDQIAGLLAGGYTGLLSFEPFAEELRALSDPGAAVHASMAFILKRLNESGRISAIA